MRTLALALGLWASLTAPALAARFEANGPGNIVTVHRAPGNAWIGKWSGCHGGWSCWIKAAKIGWVCGPTDYWAVGVLKVRRIFNDGTPANGSCTFAGLCGARGEVSFGAMSCDVPGIPDSFDLTLTRH